MLSPLQSQSDEPASQEIRNDQNSGDIQSAYESLVRLHETTRQDNSVDFVVLARKAEGQLDAEQVRSLYRMAAQSLTRSEPSADHADRRLLIRMAAATRLEAPEQVTPILTDALAELSQPGIQASTARETSLVQISLRSAWSHLTRSEPAAAERLYVAILELLGRRISAEDPPAATWDSQRALAMLGRGWATAMQADKADQAAQRLQEFIDAYPTHADAARAQAMRIRCLKSAGNEAAWKESIAEFLQRWPNDPTAPEIVAELLAESDPERSELQQVVIRWLDRDGDLDRWPLELVGHALILRGDSLPAERYAALQRRAATESSDGRIIAMVLNAFSDSGRDAASERIAAAVIGGSIEQPTPMSMEAACRWAARTQRWTLLALAAETVNLLPGEADARTIHVDRLLAEALLQTGRGDLACTWWAWVVDVRGATDFASLLRCAETAVADAPIDEATRRLDRVRRCIQDSDGRLQAKTHLIDLLDADLAIRRLDFDRARTLFDAVVRAPGTTAALRGRAQWMIGETYFLQHRFADAIDAYRRVDGLDPGGEFAPASLVQAGKAFEQLGRTRDAGVCYGTLMERFADSSYATEARHRMAVLSGRAETAPAGQDSSSRDSQPAGSRLRR
ncbi:tetratricopeptide repeat protein [Roseiconus nitratireducens]|nr:tetratricopeptide repeat protein [Roseiconus nitratireducens]